METVIALSSFEHYGSRRRGDAFSVSAIEARELEAAGLVRIGQDPSPPKKEKNAGKGKAKK